MRPSAQLATSPHNEELVAELDDMAAASRAALTEGYPFYRFDPQEKRVEALWRIEGSLPVEEVLRSIPWRGFRTDRSPEEYARKLAVRSITAVVEMATRHLPSAGEQIALELGSGVGRTLEHNTRRAETDERLKARGIHWYGESDHYYFKLTTLLGSLLNSSLNDLIRNEYKEANPTTVQAIKKEFVGALSLHLLETDTGLVGRLQTNVEQAARTILGSHSTRWEKLIEAIEAEKIPNLVREWSESPYHPDVHMRRLFEAFVRNPEKYFRDYSTDYRFRKNPRLHLGIRSPNIILGGDMIDFIDTFPENSLSVVLDIRSAVYKARDSQRDRGIVPLGLKIARRLRKGGAWLGDWPRGNYDHHHYTAELEELYNGIKNEDLLRDRTRLFAIMGPSEEFPKDYPCVPVAMLMARNYPGRTWPVGEFKENLRGELTYDGEVHGVKYDLVEVRPGMDSLFKKGSRPDPLGERREQYARRLQQMVARMQR